jgi:N-methylhydantoinase B
MATVVDPITTEIIRNAFNAAADEMNATLIRSAYTPIIYEGKDCSVALLDANHRVLGQSAGLPIFLGNLEICIAITEERYGREVWQPGDVWLMNDSFLTGTHLNDMTVYAPIFFDGALVGFSASRAHWLDIGAKDPGGPMDSTEIYQEGLRLPPLKVVDGGTVRSEITEVIALNSRFPYPTLGDLHAQIAVARTGENRLQAILSRYGRETIEGARDQIFRQSEELDRAAVRAIPDGVYSAEGCLDNDGITDDPCWIRLKVIVENDRMTIDLTESDDGTRGAINCGEAQSISACRVAFKLLINPDQSISGGTFRPLSVNVRTGSVLGAQEPAACQWYFSSLGLLIDLVGRALAPVMPESVAAASYGDSMITLFSGMDIKGRMFVHAEAVVGGWGAWNGSEGESALINSVNGSIKDFPIEVVESRYPMRIRHYGFRPDSAGAGEWRGGLGVVREWVVECDEAWLSLWFERSKTPAWGLFGGGDAEASYVLVNPGTDREQRLHKVNRLRVSRGDVIRCLSGGGGGYGDPRRRSAASIEADLASGLLSAENADRSYGSATADQRPAA